ncbi:MAG: hypothetical protein ACK5HT_11175 [Draconibacterium sp.]
MKKTVHYVIAESLPELKKMRSEIITPEIPDALEANVNSSDSPFLGYWETQQWGEETFNVSINTIG